MTIWPVTPTAPISFVSPKLAIGGISAYGQDLKRFGLVLNVAWEIAQYGGTEAAGDVHVQHARIDDCEDIEPMLSEIARATGLVLEALGQGHDVLVTCAMGRNRSGLIAAMALVRTGMNPEEAIRNVQLCRARALTNDAFTAWIRSHLR